MASKQKRKGPIRRADGRSRSASQRGNSGRGDRTGASVNLAQATSVADEALARAREMDIAPICVVVLDGGGHTVVIKREDGASFFREAIACGKAWGALAMGRSSRAIGERLKGRQSFLTAITTLADGKLVPVAGGLLIIKNEAVIGAVGVSGASSDEDEECALSGLKGAGFEIGRGK